MKLKTSDLLEAANALEWAAKVIKDVANNHEHDDPEKSVRLAVAYAINQAAALIAKG
jgi:hypothetical protein